MVCFLKDGFTKKTRGSWLMSLLDQEIATSLFENDRGLSRSTIE